MDKRQRLVPIFVLLSTLALLLACSRFTNVSGAPSPTAPPRGVASLQEYWPGWEAASWVATVIGLPLAIVALSLSAWEQKRVADALSRKPHFKIAFGTLGDSPEHAPTERRINPVWKDGERFSERIKVELIAWNIGTGSAQQVHWNVGIPGALRVVDHPTPLTLAGPDIRAEGYIPSVHRGSSIR